MEEGCRNTAARRRPTAARDPTRLLGECESNSDGCTLLGSVQSAGGLRYGTRRRDRADRTTADGNRFPKSRCAVVHLDGELIVCAEWVESCSNRRNRLQGESVKHPLLPLGWIGRTRSVCRAVVDNHRIHVGVSRGGPGQPRSCGVQVARDDDVLGGLGRARDDEVFADEVGTTTTTRRGVQLHGKARRHGAVRHDAPAVGGNRRSAAVRDGPVKNVSIRQGCCRVSQCRAKGVLQVGRERTTGHEPGQALPDELHAVDAVEQAGGKSLRINAGRQLRESGYIGVRASAVPVLHGKGRTHRILYSRDSRCVKVRVPLIETGFDARVNDFHLVRGTGAVRVGSDGALERHECRLPGSCNQVGRRRGLRRGHRELVREHSDACGRRGGGCSNIEDAGAVHGDRVEVLHAERGSNLRRVGSDLVGSLGDDTLRHRSRKGDQEPGDPAGTGSRDRIGSRARRARVGSVEVVVGDRHTGGTRRPRHTGREAGKDEATTVVRGREWIGRGERRRIAGL